MDPMDNQCFLSDKESTVNYMNCSMQDVKCIEAAYKNYTKLFQIMPKFMYKVKVIAGDYYYEKMSELETTKKAFLQPASSLKVLKCQQDIDNYIRDNMNVKLPMDGPLWRLYVQDYNPTD